MPGSDQGYLKVDFHVHTSRSPDGISSLKDMIKRAKKMSLDAIAITEHNRLLRREEAKALSLESGFLIIPGIEGGKLYQSDASNNTNRHWIGLDLDNIKLDHDITIILESIRRQGGLAIAPHPLTRQGFSNYESLGFDAVEAINGTVKPYILAPSKMPRMGNSDAHATFMLGHTWTRVYDTELTTEGILESVRRDRCAPDGTAVTSDLLLDRYIGLAKRYAFYEPLKRIRSMLHEPVGT